MEGGWEKMGVSEETLGALRNLSEEIRKGVHASVMGELEAQASKAGFGEDDPRRAQLYILSQLQLIIQEMRVQSDLLAVVAAQIAPDTVEEGTSEPQSAV